MTRNAVVSLIHSPTSPYCYKCSLFIGLNYRLCGVYNSAPQLLQYILGIFLYLLFVSGVILPRRHQILGLRDQPAQRTSGFVDGSLALRRRSLPCLAPGFVSCTGTSKATDLRCLVQSCSCSGLRPYERRPNRSASAVHERLPLLTCTHILDVGI